MIQLHHHVKSCLLVCHHHHHQHCCYNNLIKTRRRNFSTNFQFQRQKSQTQIDVDDEKQQKHRQEEVDEIGVNAFTTRTHNCGQLRGDHVGSRVTLCGWVQFQRMGKFLTLRDSYGVTQAIIANDDQNSSISKILADLPFESVVQVKGEVVRRPDKQLNPSMATGQIEVVVDQLRVLSSCRRQMPYIVRNFQSVNEQLRLKHRYIDLRTPQMQKKSSLTVASFDENSQSSL